MTDPLEVRILVSAGDLSGDQIGAMLVRKLSVVRPGLKFFAIGGERLRESGASLLEDSSNWSAIGIFDALARVPEVYRAYCRVKKSLDRLRLSGIVLIDCPAFNIRLAGAAREHGIPCVYLFPPSQWKKDLRRAARVGKLVQKVIAPFRETAELYQQAEAQTFFSGHPLLDLMEDRTDSNKAWSNLGLSPGRPTLGILPGSRNQEIRYLLPLFLETAGRMMESVPGLQCVIPVARRSLEETISREIGARGLPVKVVSGQSHAVMRVATALLLASGTATLEAALFETPMVIAYRVSPLTWWLERPFVKGARFAGLPNLLLGREAVPEFIQEKATVANLSLALENLFCSTERRERMVRDFREVRSVLGTPGVMDRVAGEVLRAFHA